MTPFPPEDLLPKTPDARWDGFFLIAIFPPDSPIRWLKFHLYVGAVRTGRLPIAVLEGMSGPGHLFETVCFDHRLIQHCSPILRDQIEVTREPYRLEILGRFRLAGAWPNFTWDIDDPDHALSARFSIQAHDRQQWCPPTHAFGRHIGCRLGNILTYFGLHSALEGEVAVEGNSYPLAGFGILEHAWGADTRLPLPNLLRGFWHWDVLSFHDPDEPHAAVAALALAPMGRRPLPICGGGHIPGTEFRKNCGLKLTYRATREVDGVIVPTEWEGGIANRLGRLDYTATVAGPVLTPFPGGAFLGFTFQGIYTPRSGSPRNLSGTGLTELGRRVPTQGDRDA
ncbi:MAG TPA: hypothetical protein ENN80_12355 [Candidatus Hydrogenedentes bacterium]|nr:hypothetical protein [Candidatus Hydrogenedentota bacterium]